MKLLVATDFTPNSLGGGPAIARQMLSGYRDAGNKIFWWSCRSPESTGEDFIVDKQFFAPIPRRLLPAKKLTKTKSWLIRFVWAPLASLHLQKIIQELKPDCIWAIPHNWSILPLYRALVSENILKARFHSSIHDFPDVHGNSCSWGRSRIDELITKQESLFAMANSQDAISHEMLNFLRQKLGNNGGHVFHDSLESDEFKFLKNNHFDSLNCILRIAFVGTILAENEFELFVKSLKMASENKANITLEFWSAHSYKDYKWFDARWMIEHGHTPRSLLTNSLAKCDWGIITMPLEAESLRYSKYSFPTKFISYLAAGLPPIILARKDSAVNQMAEKYNLGLRLHSSNLETNSKILKQNLWSPSAKAIQRKAMLRCANECFDAQKIRGTLWNCFADVSKS
jgi:hypothetical protein